MSGVAVVLFDLKGKVFLLLMLAFRKALSSSGNEILVLYFSFVKEFFETDLLTGHVSKSSFSKDPFVLKNNLRSSRKA
jgi:hypothetical protein